MRAVKTIRGLMIDVGADDIAAELLRQHEETGCMSGSINRLIWDAIRRRYKRQPVGWMLEGIAFWHWIDISHKLEGWFTGIPYIYKRHKFTYLFPHGDLPARLAVREPKRLLSS